MSNAIFPSVVRGLGYTVLKSLENSVIVQEATNFATVRVQQNRNPIWRWELQYEILFDDRITATLTYTDLKTMWGFYQARGGEYDDFLFSDPDDSNIVLGGLQLIQDTVSGTWYSPIQRNLGGQFYEDITDLNGTISVFDNGSPTSNYTIVGPGLAYPGGSYRGLVLKWNSMPTGPITATFSFYFRVRFEMKEQAMEKFSTSWWSAGGNDTSNKSEAIKLVSSRAPAATPAFSEAATPSPECCGGGVFPISCIVQTATSTGGRTVTFPNPITAGNSVVVFGGFVTDSSNNRGPGNCQDDLGSFLCGGATELSAGSSYDFGFYQVNSENLDMQVQSWTKVYSTGGAQVFTLDWYVNPTGIVTTGPSYDIIAVEFVPPDSSILLNCDGTQIASASVQNGGTPFTSSTPSQSDMFGTDILADFSTFEDSNYVMLFCILDAGSFTGVASGWELLATIGKSALACRLATSLLYPTNMIADGQFTLDAPHHFAMCGDTFYTNCPQSGC